MLDLYAKHIMLKKRTSLFHYFKCLLKNCFITMDQFLMFGTCSSTSSGSNSTSIRPRALFDTFEQVESSVFKAWGGGPTILSCTWNYSISWLHLTQVWSLPLPETALVDFPLILACISADLPDSKFDSLTVCPSKNVYRSEFEIQCCYSLVMKEREFLCTLDIVLYQLSKIKGCRTIRRPSQSCHSWLMEDKMH